MLDKQYKALIVGGSNGIGLALAEELYQQDYQIVIIDKQPPSYSDTVDLDAQYIHSDLMYFDTELFQRLSEDSDIRVLIITAGFGRPAAFEYLNDSEIKRLMSVNASAVIRILHAFYSRLQQHNSPFYCAVMGSIAGMVSSPLFSVYAGTKAALQRTIESLNIELEVNEATNRILLVTPSSLQGTKFNGGENHLNQLLDFTSEMCNKLFQRKTLWIPNYDTILKRVLDDYHNDPHAYGLHSYEYKMQSGRLQNESREIVGYMSGTFDLFHIGHLNILKRAKEHCDKLIVGVHKSGAWKGKETFIPYEERIQIVSACKYVDLAVESFTEDCDAWDVYHYNRLFVGDDYKGTERFQRYEEYFKDKGVEIVYFPYTKSTSSTQLRTVINQKNKLLNTNSHNE